MERVKCERIICSILDKEKIFFLCIQLNGCSLFILQILIEKTRLDRAVHSSDIIGHSS